MRPRHYLFDRLDQPLWSICSGVLLALSLPPYGLYPLAWLALVPLLARWSHLRHPWTFAREAYAAFLLMAVVAGFWLMLHDAMVVALLSGLGLLLAPLPHVLALTLALIIRARFGLALGLLALFANVLAIEFALMHAPGAFPWLLLGHTQADALLFNQIADLGGVGLLTLFVLLTNTLGLLFVRARYRSGLLPGFRTLTALGLMAVVSGVAVYGEERLAALPEPETTLAVGLVQPGVPASRWADATDGDRVESLASLSDRLFPTGTPSRLTSEVSANSSTPPDLIVWPEGALPVYTDAGRQQRLYARLSQWSHQRDAALLAGALTQPGPGAPYQNEALFFHEDPAVQRYAKVHLEPFGERIPLLGASPLLNAVTLPERAGARLGAGTQPVLFDGGRYQIGTVLGFESLHGDHLRRYAAEGADLLVTLAHNGWWGRSPGPAHHLGLTRLRAIEARRALVFSTVNGTSAVILPDGTIEPIAGWMQEASVRLDVPLQTTPTTYIAYGDWPGRFASFPAGGLLLLWIVAAAFYRRQAPPARKRRRV